MTEDELVSELQHRYTDCPDCHGTGTLRPTYVSTVACPRGCNTRRPPGYVWAGSHHRQVLCHAADLVAWVDEGMVSTIERLWWADIPTFTSCQGDPHPIAGSAHTPGNGIYDRYVMVIRSADVQRAIELLVLDDLAVRVNLVWRP